MDFKLGATYRLARPLDGAWVVRVVHVANDGLVVNLVAKLPGFEWEQMASAPRLWVADTGTPRLVNVGRGELLACSPSILTPDPALTDSEMRSVGEFLVSRTSSEDPRITRSLSGIEPSRAPLFEIRACSVVTTSGDSVDRVAFVPIGEHSATLRAAARERVLDPGVIAEVQPSPHRLPPGVASDVYSAGESSMGGYRFVVEMADGAAIEFVTGGIVDFPGYPDGYAAGDVRALQAGAARPSGYGAEQPEFWWCFHSPL